MPDTQTTHYEIEHFFPGFDRQKFWDLFVDHEGWTTSAILPGQISIVGPERATLNVEGRCELSGPEG